MARFLVIDDDNVIRQMMVITLESAGHSVTEAATGKEAVALFKTQPPDVVVTDVVMPDDSIELVMGLRQQNPKVPFIVVSGLSKHSAKAVEAATALRPRRTLAKPFGLPDLLGAADEVLSELDLDPPGKKKR